MKTKTNSQQISCVKSLWYRKKQAFLFTNEINMDRGLIDLLRKILRISERN